MNFVRIVLTIILVEKVVADTALIPGLSFSSTTTLPPETITPGTILSPPTTTTTTIISTTAKPTRTFNVVLVARNKTFNLTRNELDESVANAMKNDLAIRLNLTSTSISNLRLTDGGSQVTIVKRSFVASPNSDSTISFSFATDKYVTNEEVKNKLNPLNLTGYDFATENIYVSFDQQYCPTSQCSAGYSCTYKLSANHTYELMCSPVESATTSAPTSAPTPTPANQNNPNLLYLLFLLLIIPIAILIAVVAYCCWKRRDPDSRHFIDNDNSIDKPQAPNYSTKAKTEKYKTMIMGGERPPQYENIQKRSSEQPRGNVTLTNSYVNIFQPDGSDVHADSERKNNMTFSYMQTKNSKVNDDTMGLF